MSLKLVGFYFIVFYDTFIKSFLPTFFFGCKLLCNLVDAVANYNNGKF